MTTTDYNDFLTSKRIAAQPVGFEIGDINPMLFDYQRDVVRWALRRGRAAIFSRYGTGKTPMQLEWARHVSEHTNKPVLILAPLGVARQTVREGSKFGVDVTLCRSQADVRAGVNITNYEMLAHFDPQAFGGIVLDESSILKAYDGKTRTQIIETFSQTPYRLACTATPAPNDHMELGNHAEFLGIMSRTEMLAMFFVHDGGDTSVWRLKGHAETEFWGWICSWAVMLRKPSDLGYSDEGFDLPPLRTHQITVDVLHQEQAADGAQLYLMPVEALTLIDRRNARKVSMADRVAACVEIVRRSWVNQEQSTGVHTTPQIKTNGVKINETLTSGIKRHDKPQTRRGKNELTQIDSEHISTPITKPMSNDIASERARQDCDSTDLTNADSSSSSNRNRVDVPFANANQNQIGDLISTMITEQEMSEDCFATHAISSSVAFGMIPSDFGQRGITEQPNTSNERDSWIVWVNLNSEQEALERSFGDDAISVYGSLSIDEKAERIDAWLRGDRPVLITKPSICGFGLNFQHCHNAAYVGLSDSFEELDQSIHRIHRYGQTEACDIHIITSELEGAVVRNVTRKREDHERMTDQMLEHMKDLNTQAVHGAEREIADYRAATATGADWTAHLGDCVEVVGALDSASIDYSIFSPPFASLYTYSNSERDMGNCKGTGEFYEHFIYLVKELYRVTKPGRLLSFHCMNLPTTKSRDGYIGINDFRGDLIRMFQAEGFIYHSEVVIWKDPVTAMQRTKALGLLYKQLKKDSAMSRQGIPDYLVTMRKPGENPDPVTKNPDEFSVDLWQRYASPVWFDINPSDTLQYTSARDARDEKHICPLQLEVIERSLRLWTNPGDLVLSPFMGIGSEGHEAIRLGRRFVGAELKESYWRQAVKNLTRAEQIKETPTLFDLIEEVA